MNCEQRCNKTASPQAPSHLLQREKQEDGGYRVQNNIGEMMPTKRLARTAGNPTCAKWS